MDAFWLNADSAAVERFLVFRAIQLMPNTEGG
jgi:hypothetical protein